MQFNLRKWNVHDAQSLQYHANNKKIADNLRDNFPNPYTLADAFWYINYTVTQDEKRELYRTIDVDGQAVGSIGLTFKKNELFTYAEIGYWLGEEYWNKGIVTGAVKMLSRIAFEDFKIRHILAEVFTDNTASIHVLEKCRFERDSLRENAVIKHGQPKSTFVYLLKGETCYIP